MRIIPFQNTMASARNTNNVLKSHRNGSAKREPRPRDPVQPATEYRKENVAESKNNIRSSQPSAQFRSLFVRSLRLKMEGRIFTAVKRMAKIHELVQPHQAWSE